MLRNDTADSSSHSLFYMLDHFRKQRPARAKVDGVYHEMIGNFFITHLCSREIEIRVRSLIVLHGALRLAEGLLVSLPGTLQIANLAGQGGHQPRALLQMLLAILLEVFNQDIELPQDIGLKILRDHFPLTGLIVHFVQLQFERPTGTIPEETQATFFFLFLYSSFTLSLIYFLFS